MAAAPPLTGSDADAGAAVELVGTDPRRHG